MRNYSATAVLSWLTGAINSSTQTLHVSSTQGFPNQFPYTILVDRLTMEEEVIDVVSAVGTTLTVVRGVDGTTPVPHATGASVEHGVSARDYREFTDHILDTSNVHGVSGTLAGIADVVLKAGSTMTGPLVLSGDPVTGLQSTPKRYVDDRDSELSLRIDGAEARVLSLEDRLPVAEASAFNLRAETAWLANIAGAMSSQLTFIYDKLDDHETHLTTHDGHLTTLDGEISDLDSSLSSEIGTRTSQVSSLQDVDADMRGDFSGNNSYPWRPFGWFTMGVATNSIANETDTLVSWHVSGLKYDNATFWTGGVGTSTSFAINFPGVYRYTVKATFANSPDDHVEHFQIKVRTLTALVSVSQFVPSGGYDFINDHGYVELGGDEETSTVQIGVWQKSPSGNTTLTDAVLQLEWIGPLGSPGWHE